MLMSLIDLRLPSVALPHTRAAGKSAATPPSANKPAAPRPRPNPAADQAAAGVPTPHLPGLSRALPVVLALPLLTACETAVDVPEPEHTPRVALSLTIDNLPWDDSLSRMGLIGRRLTFVGVSQRLYDSRPLQGQGRDDATLEVRDAAGTVVERYRAAPAPPGGYGYGQYRPTLRYQFRPGQEYQVRAAVPGFEAAESRLTLPVTVPVQATVTPLSPNANGQDRLRVTVGFDDPGGSADYYVAAARIVDQDGQQAGFLNVEDDGIGNVAGYRLSDPASSYNLYPFTDTNLNGQRISFTQTLSYSRSGLPTGGALLLEVRLMHLTRDLYLFYNSQRQYQNNNGNPFAEPTPLYSNVSPGFGIFGGVADALVRTPL
ncbi:DUF4249 domain-containing protein [Hymenobacter gummosus]|uniref:DUF4249 domain-containing protein n=1 Tax=Hymenobacter gummosus TaxID=1776032 RepID=A0A431U4E2_9BACT|nr:DUF4249 domain-containing protein [Hymenobacter gummosus]RTQ50765.1 DUF4249 domain-containing protein [Hymenobacter gummosus]